VVARLEGHADSAQYGTFSPDGTHILTCSGANPATPGDNTLRVWPARNGDQHAVLNGFAGMVTGGAFSPDNTRVMAVATHSWEEPLRKTFRLTTLDGEAVFEREGRHFVFRPGTPEVLILSGGDVAHVRNIEDGQQRLALKGHEGRVNDAAYSPEGKHILTVSEDETARLWAAGTGKEEKVLEGHNAPVAHGAFSPDGGHVLTRTVAGALHYWDTNDGGHEWKTGPVPHPPVAAAFRPDGEQILTVSEMYQDDKQ